MTEEAEELAEKLANSCCEINEHFGVVPYETPEVRITVEISRYSNSKKEVVFIEHEQFELKPEYVLQGDSVD